MNQINDIKMRQYLKTGRRQINGKRKLTMQDNGSALMDKKKASL